MALIRNINCESHGLVEVRSFVSHVVVSEDDKTATFRTRCPVDNNVIELGVSPEEVEFLRAARVLIQVTIKDEPFPPIPGNYGGYDLAGCISEAELREWVDATKPNSAISVERAAYNQLGYLGYKWALYPETA